MTGEMLLAARHHGVDEGGTACRTLARPWMDTAEAPIPFGMIHAEEALEMAAEAVADAGIVPIAARTIATCLRRKESLGPKEKPNRIEPTNYKV